MFVFVIAFGAPYLPTLQPRTDDALELLDLKPGQTLLELGCGDGRVLLAAAKLGIKAVGYEINPLLVWYARFKTRKYRKLVSVRLADYWRVEWPPADGVYVFLLQQYMSKLDLKIAGCRQKWQKPTVRLVSFAFQIEGRQPDQEKNGMFLYDYKSGR